MRVAGPRKIYVSNPIDADPLDAAGPGQDDRCGGTDRKRRLDPRPVRRGRRATPSVTSVGENVVLVAGTLDTKGAELRFIRDKIKAAGLPVRLVDLSTTAVHTGADVPAHQVAAFHPHGASGVFTRDRGISVAGMTVAFERWMHKQNGIAGVISAPAAPAARPWCRRRCGRCRWGCRKSLFPPSPPAMYRNMSGRPTS